MDFYRNVGLYCRVSTEEQARVLEGSIKNQQAAIVNYINAENLRCNNQWGELTTVYSDEGWSAKNLLRPEIEKLIQDILKMLMT